jgi:hypothetical protein
MQGRNKGGAPTAGSFHKLEDLLTQAAEGMHDSAGVFAHSQPRHAHIVLLPVTLRLATTTAHPSLP